MLILNTKEFLEMDEPFLRYIKNHYQTHKCIFVSWRVILFVINIEQLCGSNIHQYYIDRPLVHFVFPISDNDDNNYDQIAEFQLAEKRVGLVHRWGL